MVIRVDGNDYFVKRPQGSAANVKLADGSTHKYTRNNAPGTHRLENDLEMQTRVQRFVTKLNAGQERAQCALFKKRRYHPPPRQPASFFSFPHWPRGTRAAGAAPQPREYPESAVSSVLDDTLEAQRGGRLVINNDNGSGKNSRQQA